MSHVTVTIAHIEDETKQSVYASYDSPAGKLQLCSDGNGLSRLWFEGRHPTLDTLAAEGHRNADRHIVSACRWLDEYFSGHFPTFLPQISLHGTDFCMKIWHMLFAIPYQKTVTYGSLAYAYAEAYGVSHMAAQAVGHAVGANPVCIIIPCHRVVGAGNKLTGYAEGIDKKVALLKHEGVDVSKFII